ncbi:MAG TPA: hypothetical protein VFR99_03665 [Marmoricola sp.]|nr:hypothetical protein [Marmoricola sp.]
MGDVDMRDPRRGGRQHRWVGAATVALGEGPSRRAEHASRTGRHVLPEGTRLEVLEVYCGDCRISYNARAGGWPCGGVSSRPA